MTARLSGFKFPTSDELEVGLATVLRRNGLTVGRLRLLDRKPNPRNSTFPTEIVSCMADRTGGGETIHLFVKYGMEQFDTVYGHRGNLLYEGRVYRDVLDGLELSTPKFYGIYKKKFVKAPWLVLEYMSNGHPASWLKDPQAMVRSARWIGKFHAYNENRIRDEKMRFLHRYDRDYFLGWSLRTKKLFQGAHSHFRWLAPLCDKFERKIPTLLRASQTIIHGEYFGNNVVDQSGLSRPIDWQSAAIGAGEIDLASLTNSWINPVAERCEREYVRSRWRNLPPDSFKETLEVARIYMDLRWLGDPFMMRPLVTTGGRKVASKDVFTAIKALIDLHTVGERLGLVA
jgi:hypothetical protein